MDAVFRALADPSRRLLLDRLHQRDGQTLRELCAGLDMARQSVAKHLAVLEAAQVVVTRRHGREKLHFLNVAPIQEVADRWISRYHRARLGALADLKRALEVHAVSDTAFVYVTYIRTTPEALWRALTDPAFTMRYWGAGLRSDWTVGAPVLWQSAPDEPFRDLEQRVLEAEPYRRLSYTWHNYQPEHATHFGWSAEYLARLQQEPRSKVTFELEPMGDVVKLTLTHDDFVPDSEMRRAVSDGWPEILASLKSLLETGEVLVPATSLPSDGSGAPAFAAADLTHMKFLEGRWKGTGPDGTPFYEAYDFPDARTFRSRRYADATFSAPTDGSTVTFEDGAIVSRWGEYTWTAVDVGPAQACFEPMNAPSSFCWRRTGDGSAEVVQRWTDQDGKAQSYTVPLERLPSP